MKKYIKLLQLMLIILLKHQRLINSNSQKRRRKFQESIEYGRLRVESDDILAILNRDSTKCREHLRLEIDSFQRIVRLMPIKRSGWTTEYELIVFLYWMASGCSYRVAGGFIGMSRFAIKRIVNRMLNFFCQSMRHIISHCRTSDIDEITSKFCKRSRSNIFRYAIGAIDGRHVRILCPDKKHDEYMNSKGFYSIQCQAVVDSNYMFNDVFVGFPGSVHNARVLKNSPLYKSGSYPAQPYYLLGDSGYPCKLHPIPIVTPFKNPNPEEKQFNTVHSKARNVVDCAFGMMKTRWSNVFNRCLELKVENGIKTIFSACVLHNICLEGGDLGPPTDDPIKPDDSTTDSYDITEVGDTNEALQFRNTLLQSLLN